MRFDEVIGQEEVKKHLKQTISGNRVSHAQLFVGGEGTGALPMAMAYAREILCSYAKKGEASCHLKCDKLSHPDLHLVFPVNSTKEVTKDVTSKRFLADFRDAFLDNPYLNLNQWLEHLGIGNKQGIINVLQSREIVHDLSLKPYESDYKVMIIWMPEKLHSAAANKLLKILEEPPEKTVFLLVAEDRGQLLSTILSRTQLVRISPIENSALKDALAKEYDIDEASLASIVSLADGNYLEAVRHIEQSETLNFNRNGFIGWMRLAFKRDLPGITSWVDKIASIGRERQKNFLQFGLHIFRECLVENANVERLMRVEGDEKKFVKDFAPFVQGDIASAYIEEFESAHYHIERNANPRILFLDLSIKVLKLLKQARSAA